MFISNNGSARIKKSKQEIDNEANIALEMLEKTDFETISKLDEEESKSSDEKKDWWELIYQMMRDQAFGLAILDL